MDKVTQELYAALYMLVTEIETLSDTGYTVINKTSPVMDQARSALARAKGENT